MKQLPTLLIASLGLLAQAPTHASVARDAVRANVDAIDLVVLRMGGARDVVTVTGTLPAGDDRSPPEDVALASLTGAMLDKGTTKQDKFAISKELGDVGATLGFSVGPTTLQISGKCLRKDLPLLLRLMAEELRMPAFSPIEFAKLQKQIAGSIRQQLEDTDFRADDQFSRAVYPKGHPNRQPAPEEILAAVEKAKIEEVRAFHAKYYGPTGMRLVIVGDVDPRQAQAGVKQAFAGWQGGSVAPVPPKAQKLSAPAVQTVFMPDKTNVSVVMGQPTQLRYADPDAIALRVGTRILGVGFTGRLMASVRDKEGLTYGIASYIANDIYVDGDWRIEGNFAPALLAKGLASTQRELQVWHDQGISAAELERAKSQVAGSYLVRLSTTGGMASTILQMLNAGMPLSFVDEYPQRVAALTLDQVNGAIRQHLDPAKMVIVEAGTLPGQPAAAKP